MVQKLTQRDYKTSEWSGGTTTQIAIAPEGAVYAERDFLWRVSSAAVELEESDFTPLPDYERLIATLRGEITLTHNGGAPISLQPYEVHSFSGADETHSLGRCRDFNLMLRRGRAEGRMEALCLGASSVVYDPAPAEQALLYCAAGSCAVHVEGKDISLAEGESLLLTKPSRLELFAVAEKTVVMACTMRRV